jgi:predicted DNA-binding transcriptional regulator AlpA
MRKSLSIMSGSTENVSPNSGVSIPGELPRRLMTAFEVAAFVGCHEESVRRAYLCGQLKRQRFGVRSCRFDPVDVRDWIARGAPTRVS